MADRFPLILNTNANQIQEIASGDTLDLSNNNISNAGIITASSFSGPIVAGAGVSNITAGIITATEIDLNGDLDVDGHTNLDNVSIAGVTTFTGAITANGAIDFNSDLDVDGHTNLDNVSVAGVSTFTGNADFSAGVDVTGTITATGEIRSQDDIRIQSGYPRFYLTDTNSNDDFSLINNNGNFLIYNDTADAFRLKIDGTHTHFATNLRPTVDSNFDLGTNTLRWQNLFVDDVTVTGVVTATSADINGDLDVDGHTNLDNLSVAGVSTFTGAVTTGDHVTLSGQNPRITFTDSNHNPDFELYGSAGNFKIWDSTNAIGRLVVNSNGNIDISNDLDVDGHTNLDNVNVAGVTTFAGAINGSSATFSGAINGSSAAFTGDVSVGGVLTYEDVTNVDSVGIVTARKGIQAGGTVAISGTPHTYKYGRGDEGGGLSIYAGEAAGEIVSSDSGGHGSSFLLRSPTEGFGFNHNPSTNSLDIKSFTSSGDSFTIHDPSGTDVSSVKDCIRIRKGSSVSLYHNGVGIVTTTATGVNINGICNAHSFSGALAASNLTGALPAIDGSNLTGIVLDKIFEGDTEVECVDTGSGGEVTIKADNTDVMKVIKGSEAHIDGKVGINQFSNRKSPLTVAHSHANAVQVNLSLTSTGVNAPGGGTAIFMKSSNDISTERRYGTLIKSERSSLNNGSPDFIIMKENAAANGLAEHLRIDAAGQVLPGADNQQNLGSSTKRWQNIYAADMHYSNEGDKNSIDGTWGSYTIQEGESDLFLINNRSGKKYKFNLTEVN